MDGHWGHSGDVRSGGGLELGCYQSCLNKPDKEEVGGYLLAWPK
jgi:hypothetical protein